eukprot:g8148.t1
MMAEKDDSSAMEPTPQAGTRATDQAVQLPEAAGPALVSEAEAAPGTEIRKPPADAMLEEETSEASHQAQQQGALSSEAFQQMPLLAAGSMEQLEGVAHVGTDGNEDQATNIEQTFNDGALPGNNGGQENLAVGDHPAAASSPKGANSSSPETEANSSETARTADPSESNSAQSSPEQPPERESVDGDCQTRMPAADIRGHEPPQDADKVDSTSPGVGRSDTGEEISGQFAARHEEDQPDDAGQPVGVPAVHATPSGSELRDLQPATGNNLPQDTPSCESSGVNSTVEEFQAPPPREDSHGRVLLVAGDAGKLADEVISSSLAAVAAAVKGAPREKHCQPGPGVDTSQLPIQEAWQGVPSAEQMGAEKEALWLSPTERTKESSGLSYASIRTAVVNSLLAGVYEIVSALGAVAAAKAPPFAVENTCRTAADSATMVLQHQSISIKREGNDDPGQLDETAYRPLREFDASASESKSWGQPATAADGGEEKVRGGEESEKPTGTGPAVYCPSPPSSASLRAVVVQDFMSETRETIASELLEIALGVAPATKTFSDQPPLTGDEGTGCTNNAKGHVPPVLGLSVLERESSVEPATATWDERPPGSGDEVVGGTLEDEGPTGCVPSDGCPGQPSSTSLRTAVVQDFMSDTCARVALELAAAAVEIPPDVAPARSEVLEEPVPARDEPINDTIQPDKTKGHLPPVHTTSAPEKESLVEPVTATWDERPPTSGDEVVGGRLEDEQPQGCVPSDDYPGPPSSAPLRAAVVQDFVSDTCGTIALELAAAAVEIPPDMAPARSALLEEPVPARDEPVDDTIQLNKTGDHVRQVSSASASGSESLVEPRTAVGVERIAISDGVAVNGGEADEHPTGTGATGDRLNSCSSASLRAAVVQDFMSDTCAIIASETAAPAVEIPPDMAAKALFDEPTERTFQPDKTNGHLPPVHTASAPEKESLVEPVTATWDERPPTSGDEVVGGRLEDEQPQGCVPSDDYPGPPSSAPLRAAVVQDFVSDTCGTIALELAAAAVEIPPDMAPARSALLEEPVPARDEPVDDTIQLNKTGDHVRQVSSASASGSESLVEPRTAVGVERIAISDGVAVNGEEEDKHPTETGATGDRLNSCSSASLRAAVVQDFMSDTCAIIASETAAPAVEMPPDMAAKALPEETSPIREEEPTDRNIQLEKIEDRVLSVSDATASESAEDRTPPIHGDEMADDENRIRNAPRSPTSPAFLHGEVLADIVSGAYETSATTEARTASEPSPPNEHACSASSPIKDSTTGVVELDSSRGSIKQSLTAFSTQSEQEQRPAIPRKLENGASKQEKVVQHQATVLPRRSSSTSQRSLLPSESPHIAVVDDYLSNTLSGLSSAEAESEVATFGKRDQETLDGPPREPGAAARMAAIAGDVQDGGEVTRKDTTAIQAMSNSLREAMAMTEQRLTSPRDVCSRRGADHGTAEAHDGVCSPTPPGTPEEEKKDNAIPGLEPDVPSGPNLVDNGHPTNPRSREALAFLAEAGVRAKFQGEASDKARQEAVEWLALAGAAAKTAQDRADKARADALSWLRDTGAKELSSKGEENRREETAAWLCLVGTRAKSAQDRAEKARADASSWLRDKGCWALSLKGRGTSQEEAAAWLCLIGTRAKSPQDRADKARVDVSSWLREKECRALPFEGRGHAGRLECAAWLRLAGGRAKSAQARVDKARSEAVSWLTDTGGKAVFQQQKAAGARLDATAWLATKAALELERTGIAEGTAATAATRSREGILDGERLGGCNSFNAEDAAKATSKGDEKPPAEGATMQGDSQPGSPAVCGSPRADRHSSATIIEHARVGETDENIVQLSTENGEGVGGQHPAGDNDNATASSSAYPPPPSCQSVPSAENKANATADTVADTTAAVASATATDTDVADAYAAGDFENRVGRTASTDRTAPAPWLEPATTPLARGGSFAPTAAGAEDFGRMLDVGETEWSRVSLSRTPPFDALNSPSLPLRYAPVRGRPRALPRSASEGFGAGVPFAGVNGAGAFPAGNTSIPDGSEWMKFFAPPNQMAPKGDAYRGSDSFRSADASASTTVRADSAGSYVAPGHRASGGTNDENSYVGGNHRPWRCSDSGATSEEGVWRGSLGEVHSPVGEAQSRIMSRAEGTLGREGRGGGRGWGETSEFLSSTTRSVQAEGNGGSRKRWHKQAEQSRQYMRRWEVLLGRAHRHFDGEADVRKRVSVVRRAHPDVSNEVAFVALVQSRGKSSEAAAVLHLPRAKDEAALVTMMLDVAAFAALAREMAERRRRSRQIEKHRRMVAATNPPNRSPQDDGRSHPSEEQEQATENEQQQRLVAHEQRQPPVWPATPSSQFEGDVGDTDNGRCQHRHQHLQPFAECGGSRGELHSRRSDSAPSLLPSIEGRLIAGTPPSPGSLRAVLSTSTSVAVEVPRGFGLVPEAGRAPKGEESFRVFDPKSNRRLELRAMLRARARWQRQRMAEMALPGAQQSQQRGGSGLDALTERYLRETRTLDRDSEHLDDRLRGRWKRTKQRRRGGWRDSDRNGGAAGGSTTGGGTSSSTNTTNSAWCGDYHDGGRPMFLASFNSSTVPFLLGADGGRERDSLRGSSLSTAAAAAAIAATASIDAGAGKEGGSCRVQSYFTQALGEGSVCGGRRK